MIIVTGGCGFIGSRILERLFQEGCSEKTIVVDYLTDENVKKISKFPIYDCINPHDFIARSRSLIKDSTCIFHQGAITDTTHPDPKEVMDMNHRYTKSLISNCIVEKKKIVYASSAAVYGNGSNGFKEKYECESPLNVYGFSKCLIDNWVRQSVFFPNYDIFGLRYFNVYGAGEEHKGSMSSPVLKFFRDTESVEGEIKVFEGSSEFYRDFVSVDDVVSVNIECAFGDVKPGIYNVGSGKKISFLRVAEIVRDHVDKEIKIRDIKFPDKLVGRYQANTHANLVNLRKAGYKKKMIDPEDGIKSYLLELGRTIKNEDCVY